MSQRAHPDDIKATVGVVGSAYNAFRFLTKEERDELRRRGEKGCRVFSPTEMILERGVDEKLFLVREGVVNVMHRPKEQDYVVDQLFKGSVFGELTFIFGKDTQQSFVADEKVVVDCICGEDLGTLMDDADFRTRFYKSVAAIVAERNRKWLTVESCPIGPLE